MFHRSRIAGRSSAPLLFAATVGFAVTAVDSKGFAAEIVVATILSDLQDPGSVAVRPAAPNSGVYEILVYERGAGRIVSVRSDQPNQSAEVVKGLKPAHDSGVLFVVGSGHLLVAGGRESPLNLYPLPEEGATLSADEPVQEVDASEAGDAFSIEQIRAIARTRANDSVPDTLVIATVTEGGKGQLWKVPVRADTLGELAPFRSETDAAVNPVSALATSEQGFLVAAENATAADPNVSHFTFYNPVDGSPVLRLPVELREIAGMAYSPTSGSLYVAGNAPGNEKAALYRIDDASRAGKPACTAVKITDVERPTSLAFGPDGSLYITTAGDSDAEGDRGRLQKITGEL